MKALLDTNIVIHRETYSPINVSIGILFRWLDRAHFTKCVHQVTIHELLKNSNAQTRDAMVVKLGAYEQLQTVAVMHQNVQKVSKEFDRTENDIQDTILLNELYCRRVDILITEDKKIRKKAAVLGIEDRLFTIDGFLEYVVTEYPDLVNYQVLSVKQERFGNINLQDPFFDSLREDYADFDAWFNRKAEEKAYITLNNGKVLSFLYLKIEREDENYTDIFPQFVPKKRLKIGTFKVISNGVRLGERFLKIIFDNAILNHVDEIYVTAFDKTEEQKRLIDLLIKWGFALYGTKGTAGEQVYVRDFKPQFNIQNPELTYPYTPSGTRMYMIPIAPKYHTDLLPDSYLRTESPGNFIENQPHRNAISKTYVSRSRNRAIQKGDVLVFYRSAPHGQLAYFASVITTIAIVNDVKLTFENEEDFVVKARKRSLFSESDLRSIWEKYPTYHPFLIDFLPTSSFELGHRINRKRLLEMGVLTGAQDEMRGLKEITREQFISIIEEANIDESIIVN